MATIDSDAIARTQHPPTPNAIQAAVDRAAFLVGAERSGTTLLRLMLNGHPAIWWSNEFEYAVDRMPEHGGFPPLPAYHDWLSTHRIWRATKVEIDLSLDYPALVKSFLAQRLQREGKPIVGATCHRHFDRLLRIWPDARFIHIVRDGRDVARSNVTMGWAGNVWCGVERWIDAERLWERLAQQIGPDRYIELTHESLIAEPEAQLTRVANFLGVDYHPGMLAYHQTSTYEKPNPAFLQQWKRKLSDWEVRLLEARIGDMLTARGYELSGLPRLRVTPAMQRRLRLRNWIACRFARRRRYGTSLWLQAAIAHRIGPQSWRERLTLRMNEIDARYLQ